MPWFKGAWLKVLQLFQDVCTPRPKKIMTTRKHVVMTCLRVVMPNRFAPLKYLL